jgi:pimeloyl-ACP methyl ester carboxylesterase
MRYIFLSIHLLLLNTLFAQPTELFNHYRIVDKDLGNVDYHITKKELNQSKPLLIWLDGSGCEPIVTIFKDSLGKRSYTTTIFIKYDSLSSYYHIVTISKPGIAFSKEVSEKGDNDKFGSDCGDIYNQYLSLTWRAEAVSKVIDDILPKINITKNKIIVAGHSEGASVAAKAATLNKKITHVGCFSTCGQTQFYDEVLRYRKLAYSRTISSDSAQNKINDLLKTVKDITNDPNSTNKFWRGHTYKRWASFTNETVNDNLLRLTVPIYAVNGTSDQNSMAESLDILPILFAQKGKNNLTFKTCIDCDHWYKKVTDNIKTSYKTVVFQDFFDWLER